MDRHHRSFPGDDVTEYPKEGVRRVCPFCEHVDTTKAAKRWRCSKCRKMNSIPASEQQGLIIAYPHRQGRRTQEERKDRIITYLHQVGTATTEEIADTCYIPLDTDSWNDQDEQAKGKRRRKWAKEILRELHKAGRVSIRYPDHTWIEAEWPHHTRPGRKVRISPQTLAMLRSCHEILDYLRQHGPTLPEDLGEALHVPKSIRGSPTPAKIRTARVEWALRRLKLLQEKGEVEEIRPSRCWQVIHKPQVIPEVRREGVRA